MTVYSGSLAVSVQAVMPGLGLHVHMRVRAATSCAWFRPIILIILHMLQLLKDDMDGAGVVASVSINSPRVW